MSAIHEVCFFSNFVRDVLSAPTLHSVFPQIIQDRKPLRIQSKIWVELIHHCQILTWLVETAGFCSSSSVCVWGGVLSTANCRTHLTFFPPPPLPCPIYFSPYTLFLISSFIPLFLFFLYLPRDQLPGIVQCEHASTWRSMQHFSLFPSHVRRYMTT